MASQITKGAITTMNNMPSLDGFCPTLQVMAVKKMGAAAGSEKHKLLVSDGVHYTTALGVGTVIRKQIDDAEITRNTIIKVDRCSKTEIAGSARLFILFFDITVIGQEQEKIGNPTRAEEITPTPAASSVPVSHSRSFGGGGMTGAAPATVYPIASLNPYQNKWTIKARVMKKCDVRTWSNARGEGKLFSMDLMDESGEIRCTGFTESVDKWYHMIEQDKVYYISRCSLKTANKQWTALKNDYEMTITNDTTIVLCDDASSVPEMKLNYTNIADLESAGNGTFVDVIGVATSIADIQNIVARSTGKQLVKRDIKIQDKSGAAVSLTLWGAEAENFASSGVNPIISVKAAKVSEFGGRSLSVSFSSTMQVNPDNAAAHELRGWYDTSGRDAVVKQMSSSQGGGANMDTPFKSFQEIKNANIQDKPEYFSNTATVVFVKKDNCMYQACPSADCNKKVIPESGSEYRCEKCDKLYPNFKYRLMLTVKLSDFTGSDWVTCFQESAEKLLGISADELGNLKDNNEAEFDKAMNKLNFSTHTFKLRARLDTYMDETRLKCTALTVDSVDCLTQSKRLLDEIRALEA